MTHILADGSLSNENLLMIGMGVMGSVVAVLWRITQKDNARLVLRADRCEAEHKACQAQHADAREKQAVLSNDVGHLREQLTYFREQSLRMIVPVATVPPPAAPTATQQIQ